MASLFGDFRICRDAVLRYADTDGQPVTTLLLAYDYGRRDEKGYRPSQFVSADLWGPRAENMHQHLIKGRLITCVIDDAHSVVRERPNGTSSDRIEGKINQLSLGRRIEEPEEVLA